MPISAAFQLSHERDHRCIRPTNSGFAVGTVGIVVVLTMDATACGRGLQQADCLSGQAVLPIVSALLISMSAHLNNIQPHSWHVAAVVIVVFARISTCLALIEPVRAQEPSDGKLALVWRARLCLPWRGAAALVKGYSPEVELEKVAIGRDGLLMRR